MSPTGMLAVRARLTFRDQVEQVSTAPNHKAAEGPASHELLESMEEEEEQAARGAASRVGGRRAVRFNGRKSTGSTDLEATEEAHPEAEAGMRLMRSHTTVGFSRDLSLPTFSWTKSKIDFRELMMPLVKNDGCRLASGEDAGAALTRAMSMSSTC